MRKYLGRKKGNQRGFAYMEFKDYNGEACSIQQSSIATNRCLWLGCDHETVHQVTGEKCGARMHVNLALAKRIVRTLNRWIKTGNL
jgi:hypothetical protein